MRKLKIIILRLTYDIWNPPISRIIRRMYEDGLINSRVLHEIHARIDKTQVHYRVEKEVT